MIGSIHLDIFSLEIIAELFNRLVDFGGIDGVGLACCEADDKHVRIVLVDRKFHHPSEAVVGTSLIERTGSPAGSAGAAPLR